MDNRLVAVLFTAVAVLFGAFLVLEDAGLRKLALLAGTAVIVVTGLLFVVELARTARRSFADGA